MEKSLATREVLRTLEVVSKVTLITGTGIELSILEILSMVDLMGFFMVAS